MKSFRRFPLIALAPEKKKGLPLIRVMFMFLLSIYKNSYLVLDSRSVNLQKQRSCFYCSCLMVVGIQLWGGQNRGGNEEMMAMTTV